MKCPVDGTTLVLIERPERRSTTAGIAMRVWLGPCEVDRIIERSSIGHVRTSGAVKDTTVEVIATTTTTGTASRKRGATFSALTGLLGGDED